MQKIASFNQLSVDEQRAMYEYITTVRKDTHFFRNFEEMVDDYQSLAFNRGKDIFVLLQDGEICGTIGMIVKDIETHGGIFITALNVARKHQEYFPVLLEWVEEKTGQFPWQTLRLGIAPEQEYLVAGAEKAGFAVAFRNLRMYLRDMEKTTCLTLPENIRVEPLSHLNKFAYQDVQNRAFQNVPTGAIVCIEEVEEMIEKAGERPTIFNFVGYTGSVPAFIINLEVRDTVGWIEGLAVAPELQHRGLGKAALKYSVDALRAAGAESVYLTVLDVNTKAYQLYLKYGFHVERVNSIWMVKSS